MLITAPGRVLLRLFSREMLVLASLQEVSGQTEGKTNRGDFDLPAGNNLSRSEETWVGRRSRMPTNPKKSMLLQL